MWPQKHRQLAIRADDPGVAEPFRIRAQGLGEDGEEIAVDVSPSIARIDISGTLVDETSFFGRFLGSETPYRSIRAALAAADASSAETTLVTMRSPGGEAIGMGETAAAFRAANNRVVAWAPKAFSAAYGLISGADLIAMPRDGKVGSLSAFVVTIDESGAAEKAGVKVRIHSPDEAKGGFPGAPIGEAALKAADEVAAKTKAEFAETIAEGRPALRGSLAPLMKAQTFTAAEALEAGLIDEVHDTEAEFLASLFNTNTEEPDMAPNPLEDAAPKPVAAPTEPAAVATPPQAAAPPTPDLEAMLASTLDLVKAQADRFDALVAKVDTLATHAEQSDDQKLRARIEASGTPAVELKTKVAKRLQGEEREEYLAQLETEGKSRIDFDQLSELATTYDGQDEEGNVVKIRADGGLTGADPSDVDQADARLHAMASAAGTKAGAEGSAEFQAAYESFCQAHERREVSA